MSEELLGVIITSGVTSIISVIGFIVTYKSMKRNFKEELEKEKTSIHIEKMSSIPYEILKLMDNIMQVRAVRGFPLLQARPAWSQGRRQRLYSCCRRLPPTRRKQRVAPYRTPP